MGIYVNPGNAGFEEIRNGTYIDKTGLLRVMNSRLCSSEKLICVSRPRRFGKSFAAKMMSAYYDMSCDSHALFDDLEIAKDSSYTEHLNGYHVIYLDMTNIIGEAGREKTVAFIRNKIKEELKEMYPSLKVDESLSATMINAVDLTGKKFVMLIDEWDALLRETPQMQDEYLKFLRTLFKGSGTTARIFAAAYMTGILPIKKDGSQSAISDFNEFTMLRPGKFGKYVGFSEDEVRKLCEEFDSDFEKMKYWYDGYTIKKVGSVYNPYSVMQAIQNEEFASYWRRTSAAESLLTYIDMDEEGLQSDVLSLINEEPVEVDTRSFANDFQTFSDKNDVLTLMIHLGYLCYEDEENGTGFVRIPNEEIRMEFRDMLRRAKHPELMRVIKRSDQLIKDTINGDEMAVADAIGEIRDSNYAPAFYNNEQAMRYIIKMAYISSVDQYQKIEELPSGRGLADIVFLPKHYSRLPAMVVELKWNKDTKSAIEQIREHHYPAVLQGYGKEILLVGINYDENTKEHSCKIERIERQ